MERSFTREINLLAGGDGARFFGEGIVAVAKALLQSGVSYVGGYQGSPVSQLLDVLVQARGYLDTLGVHVEACTNEASAAAMLAASVNYPVRGAVTWKSIVGTNVASDALSNIASVGVKGGALVVVGEDYGEGSSVVQERTHAFAMKSSLCLLDPRPDLSRIVDLVGHGFALSEASATPVILQLRIRACHLQGSFVCKDNVAPALSTRKLAAGPPPFDPAHMAHPPHTFAQERAKVAERLPAARRYIAEHGLNEIMSPDAADVGIVVQGGLYNTLMRSLATAGLVDARGASLLPILVLNATYPLVPGELAAFCARKRAIVVLEEGHPEFVELELARILAREGIECALRGKATFDDAGEYGAETMLPGLERFVREFLPALPTAGIASWRKEVDGVRARARALLEAGVPARPPGFCSGCPERPVFSALKLAERETGAVHVAADIGCHSFAMFEPFNIGHSITGYGMGLASAAAVASVSGRRPLATVGDGGFWHNGFLSGVTSAVKNGSDAVLLVFKNGYTSATGTQEIVSTPKTATRSDAGGESTTVTDTSIEDVLRGVGVRWLHTVHSYDVARMKSTLTEALTTREGGLKVVVAEGECQLERQRRLSGWVAHRQAAGDRVERVRYGNRRGDLLGRPGMRAPVRLPVADREGAGESVACRARHDDRRDLRGLRTVRRARSDGGAVPIVLSRGDRHAAAPCGAPARRSARVRVGEAARRMNATTIDSRREPLALLIAALGGQGGGVLTGWIAHAAHAEGRAVQATSTPGVSQRTGATTYYVEIGEAASAGRGHPVLGLAPIPGRVDVLACAELLEAARMLERGLSTPGRTLLLASTHRAYTTLEKMTGSDGRFDSARIVEAARALSRRAVLFDMEAVRARHGAVISAVVFGALAGAEALPLSRAACEEAIRASGIGVEASLAAFGDAFSRARDDERTVDARPPEPALSAPPIEAALGARVDRLPPRVAQVARVGVAQLVAYQDERYARLYLARVERVADAAGARVGALDVVAVTARNLALWMAYDDLIKVAAAKSRRSRLVRIRTEACARPEDIVRVRDFLRPGLAEIAAVLPRAIGSWLERAIPMSGHRRAGRAITLQTSSIGGALTMRILAALRPLRPYSLRQARETAAIEDWLALVERALGDGGAAPRRALELARMPRLVGGYGETLAAGRHRLQQEIGAQRCGSGVCAGRAPGRLDRAAGPRSA